VSAGTATGYTIVATSKNNSNTFTITRNNAVNPPVKRTCSAPNDGGCKTGGIW
jgi:hypothetical protein